MARVGSAVNNSSQQSSIASGSVIVPDAISDVKSPIVVGQVLPVGSKQYFL